MSKMVNLHNDTVFRIVLHSPLLIPRRPMGTEKIFDKYIPSNQVKETSKIQDVPLINLANFISFSPHVCTTS